MKTQTKTKTKTNFSTISINLEKFAKKIEQRGVHSA